MENIFDWDEDEELLFIAFAFAAAAEEEEEQEEKRKRKKQKIGSYQVERPLRDEKKNSMEMEKKVDPSLFHEGYGMTPDTFDELLLLLGPHIAKITKTLKNPVGAAERLGIALRYLATGMSQKHVAEHFSVARSTTCKIIHEVCKTIWDHLGPQFMAKPTSNDWRNIAKEFHSRWGFPNCLGVIDAKLIQVQKPQLCGSFSYKQMETSSVVLIGVADAACNFINLDICYYNKEDDSSVLDQSSFGKALQEGSLSLPESNGVLPYVFVGDEAFPLKPHIICPYPENQSTGKKEKNYNHCLSLTQKVAENAFRIMAAKWQILQHTIVTKTDNLECIIKAIGVLHNYLMEKEDQDVVDVDVTSENCLPDVTARLDDVTVCSSAAENIRESFADHLNSPQGSLLHQNDIAD